MTQFCALSCAQNLNLCNIGTPTNRNSQSTCHLQLRVCEKCIQDDIGIGRVRNCGICGVVACDEK